MDTLSDLGLMPDHAPDDMRGIAGRGHRAAEVMKTLEKLYESRRPGLGFDLIVVFAPIYVVSGILATNDYPGVRLEYFLYTSVSLVLYLAVFAWWSMADRRNYKRFLDENISFDDALVLISEGGPDLGRIRGWIPAPFAWFFSSRLPLAIPPRVWLVARNIDWYLYNPRPLVRVQWWAIALYWLTGLTYVSAKFFLSPKIEFPYLEDSMLVVVIAISVVLAAVAHSVYSHSKLREDLRITMVHDLLKPYLESLVQTGLEAERELPREVPDEGKPAGLQITPIDCLLNVIAILGGITYVILRLNDAAPDWLHRPVNVLIAVVTWYFAAQFTMQRMKLEPLPRGHYWSFALYPGVASAVGFAIDGPIQALDQVVMAQLAYFLICCAGALGMAYWLLGIEREKLGEFMAGLTVWNVLVFGTIGLISMILNMNGHTL